jgi:hypothetical protein
VASIAEKRRSFPKIGNASGYKRGSALISAKNSYQRLLEVGLLSSAVIKSFCWTN